MWRWVKAVKAVDVVEAVKKVAMKRMPATEAFGFAPNTRILRHVL